MAATVELINSESIPVHQYGQVSRWFVMYPDTVEWQGMHTGKYLECIWRVSCVVSSAEDRGLEFPLPPNTGDLITCGL